MMQYTYEAGKASLSVSIMGKAAEGLHKLWAELQRFRHDMKHSLGPSQDLIRLTDHHRCASPGSLLYTLINRKLCGLSSFRGITITAARFCMAKRSGTQIKD